MLLKNPSQSTGDVPGLWGSRLAAPIVLGALLVMPPIAYATSNATTSASHPVRTLLEERVGAVAVLEVVVLRWFVVCSGAGGDGVAVNEHFDGAHVAAKYPAWL
jgi:hypothetical protein